MSSNIFFPRDMTLEQIIQFQEDFEHSLLDAKQEIHDKKLELVQGKLIICQTCHAANPLGKWRLVRVYRSNTGESSFDFATSLIICPSSDCKNNDNYVRAHSQFALLVRLVDGLDLKHEEIFNKVFRQNGNDNKTRRLIDEPVVFDLSYLQKNN